MSKGDRRERQAEEFYQRAGFKTEITRGLRWGKTDWFGLFDVMAIHPDRKVRFCQVKSNQARGIRSWVREARMRVPSEHVELDFLVCHDRTGWRLIQPDDDGYTVVLDERGKGYNMGEGVVEYLSP